MKDTHIIDEARLGIMLNELRLPTIKTLWPQFADQADREGWPAARFLSAIAEHELASAIGAGSNDTSPKRIFRLERPSTASPSTRCRWSPRPRSWQ